MKSVLGRAFIYKPNLKKRIVTTFIDYTIILLFSYLYLQLFGHDTEDGSKEVSGFLVLPLPIAWFLYFVVVEAFYGGTLAHNGMYLKVITVNRKEISLSHSMKRHLLDPIDFSFVVFQLLSQ